MGNDRIKKVLIANRGEIALRIQQACEKLRLPCAITVSEVDRGSFFAKRSKQLAPLSGKSAQETYLDGDKIIEAARATGCNAIHPGYGFLSENGEFARRVESEGIIFVGPTAASMELLGDKKAARRAAERAKVPCVPGSGAEHLTDRALLAEAKRIGFPVIIKAAFGGGGRGMRVAASVQELAELLPRARGEALKNFGNDTVFLERFLEHPRHVEVQIFGDSFGTVIHFGTRECSVQRRHQKVIEEAPAPRLSSRIRNGLHTAAVRLATQVGYRGAGTAEFLVDGENFYFLEMNTRIQVEHPVTEQVFGVDLVTLQFDVANGKRLPGALARKKPRGHSIQFRIYAEDVRRSFQPALGRIEKLSFPRADDVRVERGFEEGDTISPYYDAMIAKLIVTGESRSEAIERSRAILAESELFGLPSTLELHRWILDRPEFLESALDVRFLDRELGEAFLSQIAQRQELDPAYRPPRGKRAFCERRAYHSIRFDAEYELEIVHRLDRTFLVYPCIGKKRATDERFMRRSCSREAAVQSVIQEVLEVIPPEKIL